VKGCEIKKCITGIEVLSGDPLVLFCSVKNCWENGILTIAKDGLRCDSLIKMSWIRQCRDNGILCAGFNNHTRIEKCHEIQSNRLVGIKAVEQSSIVIIGNKIFGNFQQGILLTDGTSAHIEQNDVYTNFKANIAMGGVNSGDTVVLRNRIRESRAEGIFLMESGYS
jgi:parallel beta-helix repeat protein